ncbi:hypothetical protein FKG94_12865 [Exilibacterium tricleocarpae]|uniref:Lipoprotein n=1 Tax=Exilibacterium tricleocarpae TaxID=2591008 RepID=A0A545TNW2_9GAMM|nr:hypothetical protein [Exilibacterium tricleocarpae]TQV78902.1 hypothetical protein FKG94_12865 [Exilibacterium tricleocarpae]
MNCINRFFYQSLIVSLMIFLSGCSREPKIWLYNFSGASVNISYPGQQILIEHEDASLFKNWGAKRNTLEPYDLKVGFGENSFCYFLQRITIGGYAQYDTSKKLVLRLRLDQDKSISVYKANGDFNSRSPLGIQPKGYPSQPERCPND